MPRSVRKLAQQGLDIGGNYCENTKKASSDSCFYPKILKDQNNILANLFNGMRKQNAFILHYKFPNTNELLEKG